MDFNKPEEEEEQEEEEQRDLIEKHSVFIDTKPELFPKTKLLFLLVTILSFELLSFTKGGPDQGSILGFEYCQSMY